jgi:hypothetical protein
MSRGHEHALRRTPLQNSSHMWRPRSSAISAGQSWRSIRAIMEIHQGNHGDLSAQSWRSTCGCPDRAPSQTANGHKTRTRSAEASGARGRRGRRGRAPWAHRWRRRRRRGGDGHSPRAPPGARQAGRRQQAGGRLTAGVWPCQLASRSCRLTSRGPGDSGWSMQICATDSPFASAASTRSDRMLLRPKITSCRPVAGAVAAGPGGVACGRRTAGACVLGGIQVSCRRMIVCAWRAAAVADAQIRSKGSGRNVHATPTLRPRCLGSHGIVEQVVQH